MKIRILNTDYELNKDGKRPIEVSFTACESIGEYFDSRLEFKLDDKGALTIVNKCLIERRKNNKYGGDPLRLTTEDLPSLEAIVSHWKKISKHFIKRTSYGGRFSGLASARYIFPDGAEKEYKVEEEPKEFEIKIGEPFDTIFPSEGCKYIYSYPYRQHYKLGRLDYYLKKESISIESPETIQYLEGNKPDLVLEILRFIDLNQEEALCLLHGDQGRSRVKKGSGR